MDNVHRSDSLPGATRDSAGVYLRNAVNVTFDALGKPKLITGTAKIYSGTGIHSFWRGYFIEGTDLKFLNPDNTATTLGAVGSRPMGYASVGNRVFCGNGLSGYVIKDGVLSQLGVEVPSPPEVAVTSIGGLYGGDYQVAIAFMRGEEESGLSFVRKVSVLDGQGISVTLPAYPADITGLSVYCSSVNGDELFLYSEEGLGVTEVSIINELTSIRCETQFLYPPVLSSVMQAHYGRIYWADGNLLRWTEAQRYGYTRAGYYAPFDGEITLIAEIPGTIYVCAGKTYRLTNIDGDGFPQRMEVFGYGAVKGTLTYDEITKTAYWQSQRGFVKATVEGATEMLDGIIAMPSYNKGCMTLSKQNGVRNLISVSQGGTPSLLQDRDFKAAEILRTGSAL